MTMGRAHNLKANDIHQIIKLFPMEERVSIKWSFLFVAPVECAEGIAKTHATLLERFEVDRFVLKVDEW